MKKKIRCPVCGYDKLTEPPHDELGQGSFEICPNCNTEFGFDDAVGDPNDLPERWAELRKNRKIINIDKFTDEELFEILMNLPEKDLAGLLEKYNVIFKRKSSYSREEKMELANKAIAGIIRYALVKELGLEKRHQNGKH